MGRILGMSLFMAIVAGTANADISFSGTAYMGLGSPNGGVTWQPIYNTTLSITFSGETDGGLSFGVDLNVAPSPSNSYSGSSYLGSPLVSLSSQGESARLWVSGDMGIFSLTFDEQ